jgi:Flp pilus assembly protein TadB
VLFTTLSTILLLAPSSYHRLRFRDHQKGKLIEISNQLAIAGMVALALAIDCAVYLVTSYVFDVWAGIVAVALATVGFAGFWYVLPFTQSEQ